MTNLKKYRTKAGKRLREIAQIIGVTPQTIQQMEQRGIVKPSTAMRYVPAFPDLSWQDLMDDPRLSFEAITARRRKINQRNGGGHDAITRNAKQA